MTSTSSSGGTHVAPQADHGDPARTWIARIADGRAWLFLAGLIICFEVWSRLAFGATFVLNPFNVQSI
ncbi:ribose ABC transporter, permease protein, partial [Mesorhizobium amorphae CCNWGS0123]